jgi:hypothetical protein
LFTIGCKDNSDASCYCPDESFVQNVFDCMYAHGESDEEISEAVSYFQGICGSYIDTNPCIATGAASLTSALTATATPATSAIYTTVVVDITTVVPCTTTDSAGSVSTLSSSSSTVVINTAVTIPQVVLTSVAATASNGATVTGGDVAVVPGTYSAVVPVKTATATTAAQTAPYPTSLGSTLITAKPTGTGVYTFSGTASTTAAFSTAGAAHYGSGLGFLGFAALAVAAL